MSLSLSLISRNKSCTFTGHNRKKEERRGRKTKTKTPQTAQHIEQMPSPTHIHCEQACHCTYARTHIQETTHSLCAAKPPHMCTQTHIYTQNHNWKKEERQRRNTKIVPMHTPTCFTVYRHAPAHTHTFTHIHSHAHTSRKPHIYTTHTSTHTHRDTLCDPHTDPVDAVPLLKRIGKRSVVSFVLLFTPITRGLPRLQNNNTWSADQH